MLKTYISSVTDEMIIEGNMDDIIEIDLSEEPVLGIIWHINILNDDILRIVADEYEPSNNLEHGQHIYKFVPQKLGETHVEFSSNADVSPRDPVIKKFLIKIVENNK